MLQIKVNKFITLSLEDGKIKIYVNDKVFSQFSHIVIRSNLKELINILNNLFIDQLKKYLIGNS